jgi:anti-anti-sigma factor
LIAESELGRVLISPHALDDAYLPGEVMIVNLAGKQIEDSPPLEWQIWRKHRKENASMETTIAREVLTVAGFAQLTAANIKLFRKKVCSALNGHTVVEIDLSQTTFMDCAGVAALIGIRKLIRGGKGAVRLMNPTSPVRQMLELVRAGQILEIVNTRPADHLLRASHRLFTFGLFHFLGLPLPGALESRSPSIAKEEKCPPRFRRSGGTRTDRRRQAQPTWRRQTGHELQKGGQTSAASHEHARHPHCRWSHPLCLAEGIIESSVPVTIT